MNIASYAIFPQYLPGNTKSWYLFNEKLPAYGASHPRPSDQKLCPWRSVEVQLPDPQLPPPQRLQLPPNLGCLDKRLQFGQLNQKWRRGKWIHSKTRGRLYINGPLFIYKHVRRRCYGEGFPPYRSLVVVSTFKDVKFWGCVVIRVFFDSCGCQAPGLDWFRVSNGGKVWKAL